MSEEPAARAENDKLLEGKRVMIVSYNMPVITGFTTPLKAFGAEVVSFDKFASVEEVAEGDLLIVDTETLSSEGIQSVIELEEALTGFTFAEIIYLRTKDQVKFDYSSDSSVRIIDIANHPDPAVVLDKIKQILTYRITEE